MSITSDLRAYAEKAAGTAQAQLNDVAGTANEYVGKARDNVQSVADKAGEAVNDLRASAEKAINLDAIKSAVEPYLAQVKEYGSAATDRAEALLAELKKTDPRVAKLIDAAGSATETVVATVNTRVVKPVQGFTGRGAKAKPAPKASSRPATKASTKRPATTKPAGRPATDSTTASEFPATSAPEA